MKAKFLIVSAALTILSAPAFASTPASDPFGALSNDQAIQGDQGQYPSDTSSDGIASPFADRALQDQSEDRGAMDMTHNHTNLQPPRMDASGVPDPRI